MWVWPSEQNSLSYFPLYDMDYWTLFIHWGITTMFYTWLQKFESLENEHFVQFAIGKTMNTFKIDFCYDSVS